MSIHRIPLKVQQIKLKIIDCLLCFTIRLENQKLIESGLKCKSCCSLYIDCTSLLSLDCTDTLCFDIFLKNFLFVCNIF